MKNKLIIFAGIFACFAAHAADYIDMQIRELQQRRDELKAELDACEENTRKFKIAGVATLGATGVGVVGNIALHNEIKKIEQSKNGGGYSGGGDSGAQGLGHLSKEQKQDVQCKEIFCLDDDLEMAEANGCEC
jgi:hypothetical protein